MSEKFIFDFLPPLWRIIFTTDLMLIWLNLIIQFIFPNYYMVYIIGLDNISYSERYAFGLYFSVSFWLTGVFYTYISLKSVTPLWIFTSYQSILAMMNCLILFISMEMIRNSPDNTNGAIFRCVMEIFQLIIRLSFLLR